MAKQSGSTLSALEILSSPQSFRLAPVTILAGTDAFLRHEARRALLAADSDDDEPPFVDMFDGKRAELRDLLDALAERTLFGEGNRLVVVEDADPFIKCYRPQLENYCDRPAPNSALVLEVQSWPSNTRLAKRVTEMGLTVQCQAPSQGRELTSFLRSLKDWLVVVAQREYQTELQRPAVDLLLEKLPPEPGLVFQEVAKLANLAGTARCINVALVHEHVGGWRLRRAWDMIDAAADGRAAEALEQLDRLLAAGEEPHALLPQMASTLRHLATAVRLFEQAEKCGNRLSLRAALEQAGTPPFKLSDAQRQLQQIGRHRARRLYEWLLSADLDLKGHNSTKDRARRVLETLIVRLAKQNAPQASP